MYVSLIQGQRSYNHGVTPMNIISVPKLLPLPVPAEQPLPTVTVFVSLTEAFRGKELPNNYTGYRVAPGVLHMSPDAARYIADRGTEF